MTKAGKTRRCDRPFRKREGWKEFWGEVTYRDIRYLKNSFFNVSVLSIVILKSQQRNYDHFVCLVKMGLAGECLTGLALHR